MKPIVAGHKPIKVALKGGQKYAYCTCGRSSDQPFCDGSHKGTEFSPLRFTAEKDETKALCTCKHTGNAPFCDGTHNHLSEYKIDQPGPGFQKESDLPKARASKLEPHIEFIHQLARDGLSKMGDHGPTVAMGVSRKSLPKWDDLQLLTAQLATPPLLAEESVVTELVVGPKARKPLILSMPLFVSDMSYGALSPEAKTALATGAEIAGTGICSGEGGSLPAERQANSRYFFELASARFGYSEELLTDIQAFHFKAGQAAKTGVGGQLPAEKVDAGIAQVRDIEVGGAASSPSRFPNLITANDFRKFADHVREVSGGVPIGFKMSAQHLEQDIAFALEASADYIILDGRGGATGGSPAIIRDNIGVPTMAALARAHRFLERQGARDDVTLIVTGGLRVPQDFVKAMALGANGIALANSAIQAIGCVAARICHTNNCPSGVATQKQDLRQKLPVEKASQQLARFLNSSVTLMQMLARACGHGNLQNFSQQDLTTWHYDLARLTGVSYAGLDSQQ